ncbi:hypothetical protein [Acidithiobacillus caldus]|uniref:hypothetical protein n=1 Tax=Acidithiobacillus caldus TaxID=33059 RepID=UPI001D026FB3|nr:hypothetical protein [Acidithiobacillus caldus]
MDVQETIDSLRGVLESVIAPGVESLGLRLDALERDLQENGQGIDRLDARIDRLTGRMEEGFFLAARRPYRHLGHQYPCPRGPPHSTSAWWRV